MKQECVSCKKLWQIEMVVKKERKSASVAKLSEKTNNKLVGWFFSTGMRPFLTLDIVHLNRESWM